MTGFLSREIFFMQLVNSTEYRNEILVYYGRSLLFFGEEDVEFLKLSLMIIRCSCIKKNSQ